MAHSAHITHIFEIPSQLSRPYLLPLKSTHFGHTLLHECFETHLNVKYRAENMKTDKFEQSSQQTQLTFF